jgi:hypothetical protein
MNKRILMMTAMITISGMNFEAQASETKASKIMSKEDFETKWCRDASFILRTSLNAAYNATTFEQEIAILKSAISRTLNTLNPKFTYYLESTLELGLKLERAVATPKDKTLVLRRNIENALDDLDYLDGRFGPVYSQDHVFYVRKVLTRVSDEAYRAKTDLIENIILDAGASSAVQILSESDNRRDPANACAARYLKEILKADDVFIKRSLISEALDSLGYGCRF